MYTKVMRNQFEIKEGSYTRPQGQNSLRLPAQRIQSSFGQERSAAFYKPASYTAMQMCSQ
jgi:hypothetical protein